MRPTSESGNALWFILVAIILIGILTAVLSRSSSSTDQSGNFEQKRIAISQMLRYAKGVEVAIQQMMLNGISETEISFENNDTAANYTNANCDTAADRKYPDCLLFNVQGAGLTYKNFPDLTSNDWVFSGRLRVGNLGIDDNSAADSELIMVLPNLTETMCIAINNELGVTNPAGIPPQDSANAVPTPIYTGTFTTGNLISATEINDKTAACFEGGGNPAAGTYHFYQVLLIR